MFLLNPKLSENALESVQRRFLKCLSLKTDGSYPSRGICENL